MKLFTKLATMYDKAEDWLKAAYLMALLALGLLLFIGLVVLTKGAILIVTFLGLLALMVYVVCYMFVVS